MNRSADAHIRTAHAMADALADVGIRAPIAGSMVPMRDQIAAEAFHEPEGRALRSARAALHIKTILRRARSDAPYALWFMAAIRFHLLEMFPPREPSERSAAIMDIAAAQGELAAAPSVRHALPPGGSWCRST